MALVSRPTALRTCAIALSIALSIALLLGVNFALSFHYSMPPPVVDWHARAAEQAAAAGRAFDRRSSTDVLLSCRENGCRPYIGVRRTPEPDGRLLLAGAAAHRHTLLCNENGKWKFVATDRYGFNANADPLFEQADIVLMGDSFGAGWCVEEDATIATMMRAHGLRLLNLAVSGYQPLDELAALKEYAPRMKTLIWLFYEGNDTDPALNQEFLLNYLRPEFTQLLKQSADEINQMYERAGNIDNLQPEPQQKPLIQHLRDLEKELRYKVRPLFAPTASFLLSFRSKEIEFDSDLYRRILQEGRRLTRERGAERFILVYLPAWERFMWKPRQHPDAIQFDHVREAVRISAAMTGFEFIDVAEVFYGAPDPLDMFPFHGYGHYNETGYSVAGQAILAALATHAKSK
jgi:hypothetical protein